MPITSQEITDLAREYSKKFLLPAESPRGIFDVVTRGEKLSKTGTFDYWEKLRRPRAGAVGTGGYTAGGTLTVTSALPFYVNAIIQMVNVKYRITAINATGLVLTLAVVNGTDADRAAGVVITVLTNAIAEGGGGVINARNPEVKRTNTTQIMFDIMQISKSAGLSAQEVDGKEFAKQLADKMAQFRNDTRGLLWSDYYEAADTKGDIAIAGGIPHYVHANGYNPTATALNAVNLSEFVRHLYDNIGATPKELWMNPVDRATISTTFDATFFRRDADSTRRGVVAETFMTTNGVELTIHTDVKIPANTIYCLNSKDVVIRPFRDLAVTPVATLTDTDDFKIVAELSCEINPSSQMGRFRIS